MRTRALFQIVLGFLVLAAVIALDIIAFSYRALQGVTLEAVRGLLQAMALSWMARGSYILFFKRSAMARADDKSESTGWPVRLVRRFTLALGLAVGVALLPSIFNLSLNREFQPTKPASVISIDLMGVVWTAVATMLSLGFWQLLEVRQQTHINRRRFTGWILSLSALSAFYFVMSAGAIPMIGITIALLTTFGALALAAALMLGYRLPWIPYVPAAGKRRLLTFSGINLVLAALAFLVFTGDPLTSNVLKHFGLMWHVAFSGLFVTLVIYFALVFFSTLFSLSSTQLVERKDAEVKSLVKLTRFSSDVLSSELLLDLPKLAEQITTLASEATGADCAWLELHSNGSETRASRHTVRSHVHIDPSSADRIMNTSDSFPEARAFGSPKEELQKTGKAILLRKKRSPRELWRGESLTTVNDRVLHSLIAVPLVRKGEVRGSLYVAKRQEDAFDTDDMTVLAAFSDVASLALETARLLADSIEKQKLDGELRAARAMQKSLLPEVFPSIPRFDIDAVSIPAYEVGGDYYDFSTLWQNTPIVVVGDVSGKGISASLYMAETKGVVQALAPLMSSMQELVTGVNNSLLRNNPTRSTYKRSFVTLGAVGFYSEEVRFTRAGHTPLLHVKANGESTFYQPKGMAIGLIKREMFDAVLEEITVHPTKGDVLVLFSDGITDVRDGTGEEFGYQRLALAVTEALSFHTAHEITAHILNAVEAFSGSRIFSDDATLVVMRCNEDLMRMQPFSD